MAIVRWNPIGGLAAVEFDRLNRLFDDLHSEGTRAWVPAVDIYETEGHEVVIKAELPDVRKEDISVTFENGVLTLTGRAQAGRVGRERAGAATRAASRRVLALVHAAGLGRCLPPSPPSTRMAC